MPDKEKDWMLIFVLFAVLLVILPMMMWVLWGVWGDSYMHGMGGMMGFGWGVHAADTFCVSDPDRAWCILPAQRSYGH